MIHIREENVLDEYRIQVHALKSSSKMIGILGLSGLARACELAAKESDIERICVLTPGLLEELLRTKENLSVFRRDDSKREQMNDNAYLRMILQKVKSSAEEFDIDTLDVLSEEITKYRYDDRIAQTMDLLVEQIRNLQMEDVCETAGELLLLCDA